MREPIRDLSRLQHILEQIDFVAEYVSTHTYEDLLSNKLTQYGLVKCIEIIGEAAYMLSLDFKEQHPQTNWRIIVNMRHVLVHGYFNITMPMVWVTATTDLPTLRPQIVQYISELEEKNK